MHLVVMTLEEFFQTALAEAIERERVRITDAVRQYVVLLLARQDYHPGEALGIRFAHALDAVVDQVSKVSVMQELQDIGDRALIASGLWWEREFRPRRVSNLGVHRAIGQQAYRMLGEDPFSELAEKFEGIVDVLMRLSTDRFSKSAPDILRLYAIWEETGSGYAARALAKYGINPARNSTSRTPS